MYEWDSPDVAVRHEARIATEGGMVGWDHTDGGQPIPSARIGTWMARRRAAEERDGRLGL
jgi:hypothetical protein